jgi:hypothetical protein
MREEVYLTSNCGAYKNFGKKTTKLWSFKKKRKINMNFKK